MVRVGHILLAAALMVSIGVPLALLQSVAWLGMSVSYTIQTGSVAAGLRNTFDGEHPCRLCRAVDKGRQTGQKDSKEDVGKKKVELFVQRGPKQLLTPPPSRDLPRPCHVTGRDRSEAPPDEPPREV